MVKDVVARKAGFFQLLPELVDAGEEGFADYFCLGFSEIVAGHDAVSVRR